MVTAVVWAVEPVFILSAWNPFPIEGYFAQHRYRGEGLGSASSDPTDFVDPPWEASPWLSCGWGG